MKGSGRRLYTNASDFKVWKGEAFSGTRDRLGWSGHWVGVVAREMAPGTSPVRMEKERGRLGFGFSCEVWKDP